MERLRTQPSRPVIRSNLSRSQFVFQRFGLKLGLFVLFSMTGLVPVLEGCLGDLAFLAGSLSALLALKRGELPLARRLNYWDEVWGFGMIACLF